MSAILLFDIIELVSHLQAAKEASSQSLDPAKIKKIYVLSALLVSSTENPANHFSIC